VRGSGPRPHQWAIVALTLVGAAVAFVLHEEIVASGLATYACGLVVGTYWS
jgi:hypothetical protein